MVPEAKVMTASLPKKRNNRKVCAFFDTKTFNFSPLFIIREYVKTEKCSLGRKREIVKLQWQLAPSWKEKSWSQEEDMYEFSLNRLKSSNISDLRYKKIRVTLVV